VGLMPFSVGGADGAVVAVVVVVVVVVDDGAWLAPLPHAAAIAPMAMTAAPPATASMRRPMRFGLVVPVPCREPLPTLLRISTPPYRHA
jgi:hypothetical protein